MRKGLLGIAALLGGAAWASAQELPATGAEKLPAATAKAAEAPGPVAPAAKQTAAANAILPPAAPTIGDCCTAPTICCTTGNCCQPERLWMSADYLLWWLKAQ